MAGGLHVYTPLPFSSKGGLADLFRVHYFANAGNVDVIKGEKVYSISSMILTLLQVNQFNLTPKIRMLIGHRISLCPKLILTS